MRAQIVALIVGDCTPAQAARARALVAERGNLAEELIAAGIAPEIVLSAASTATGLPIAHATWLRDPRPPAVRVDVAKCRRLGVAPIASIAGKLCFGYSDPELALRADTLGLPAHTAYLALPSEIARVLARLPAALDSDDAELATYAQSTLPATPRAAPAQAHAWEPGSESAGPTRAMDARQLRALSRQSSVEDSFNEPTDPASAVTVPARAAGPAQGFVEPPPTVSDATMEPPALRAKPTPPPPAPMLGRAHEETAAEGLQPAAIQSSELFWEPLSQEIAQPEAAPAATPPHEAPTMPPLCAVPPPATPATPAFAPVPPIPSIPSIPSLASLGMPGQTSAPGAVTEGLGLPTLQRDTRGEAREYLEENPPTILEKGPKGTRVESVRLVSLGALTEPPVHAAPAPRSALPRVALLLVAVLALVGALWWLLAG